MSEGFNFGGGFVTLGVNLGGFNLGLGLAKTGLTSAVAGMAIIAKGGMSVLSSAFSNGIIPLISMASNMEESRSKFAAVFKDQEDSARAFAASFAQSVGRSQLELETFMSGLQNTFVSAGFARDEGNKLSQTVTRLAVDLASFNNLSDEEALTKLKAGLAGEAEGLKSLGVFINETVLNQKLMQMGFAKNSQEATEQQKILARLAIITESTKDAQGDAAKTSGSLANSWKGLTGSLFDLGSEIGSALIPAAQSVIGAFRTMIGFVKSNQEVLMGWVGAVGSGFSAVIGWTMPLIESILALGLTIYNWGFGGMQSVSQLGESFGWIGGVVGTVMGAIGQALYAGLFAFLNLDLTVQTLGVVIAQTFDNGLMYVSTFVQNAVTLFSWLGSNWYQILETTVSLMWNGLKNFATNVSTIFSALVESIRTGSLAPLQNAWNNEMKGMFEGAVNTISAMPEFKPYVATDAYNEQLNEIGAEWAKRTADWEKTGAESSETIAGLMGDGLKEGIKTADFTGQVSVNPADFNLDPAAKKKSDSKGKGGTTTDLAGAFNKIQEAALKGKDTETKKQTEVLKTIATNTDPSKQKKTTATYGA